ncbi:hypothetical protein F4814DRAFT_455214 [Daldinia grandis]|nr:hypothetical protein F4814DRAFT_455214 [Daldinia grandis]
MDFITLPAELRLSILEMVAYSSTERTTEYTTVSREWQSIFEKKHFERILLSSRRLKRFAQIVRGSRRKLVKHIWFRAELGDVNFGRGDAGLRPTLSLADESEFDNTIVRLLQILSTWERPHDLNRGGLTLELSAWSLDDYTMHGLTHQGFMHDPYSQPYKYILESQNPMSLFYDLSPEGISSRSGNDLTMEAEGTETKDIPKVDVVTTFLLRRQYYSHVSPDRIAQIFGSMAGLERIIYEPPERTDRTIDTWQEKHHWLLSDYSFPQTLRQLAIFEEPFYRNAFKTLNQTGSVRCPEITAALFRESQTLEQLSASFVVDAKDFFQPFWPSNPASPNRSWDNLKTIALTSKLLNPYQSLEEVNDLLCAAGIAARNMPTLRVMEIWNGSRTAHGCFFRYYDDGSTSTITWRGTWELDLEPRVMRCWTETVRKNTRYLNVGFRDMELPIDGTSFPASILRYLKLKDQIVHPVSFCQLQLLGEPRRYK